MTITPSSRNDRHLVIFTVAPYTFCAPTGEVERFIKVTTIRRLPQAPPAVIGVINHRGQVFRVVSLRRKLGLETGPPKTEGPLILTRLPSGPTAFLVDEVVDVVPAARLELRPLSPHSTMDLFDAFVLRDDQVLFRTRFDRLDQAQTTPFPNPDLKMPERLPVEVEAPEPTGGADSVVDAKEVSTASPFPGEEDRRKITPPENAISKATAPGLPEEAVPPRPAAAGPPASVEPRARPLRPRARRAKPARPVRFKTPPRRARRYALALTAVLVLLLVVVFSSAWLLKGRLRALDRDPGKIQPLPPATVEATVPLGSAVTAPAPPPVQQETKSEDTLPSAPSSLSPPPEKAAPSSSQPAAPPDAQTENPPIQPLVEKKPPDPAPGATLPSPREILRLETETFTLMVERPSTKSAGTAAQAPPPVPPPHTAITHVVVAGDTLWDIAAHYLGDPFQYPELARLSRIHDPNLIYPGDVIRIIKKNTPDG